MKSPGSPVKQPQNNNNSSPKKILFLAANPKNTPLLSLDEEVREIDEGLKRSQQRNQFKLEHKWAVRIRDFRRHILEFQPQIVHFSGHGAGTNGIILENEMGNSFFVQADALANFFSLFAQKGLECILLNSCYSKVQAKAISQHIDYVVGMKHSIGDRAAIEFAVAFYDALGAGYSIEFAYQLGCSSIQLYGIPGHLTPVLFYKGKLLCFGNNETRQAPSQVIEKLSTKAAESKPSKTTLIAENNPVLNSDNNFVRQFAVTTPQSKTLSLQIFSFDTLILNAEGKETKRSCKQAEYFTEKLDEIVSLDMVKIPGGSFMMGANEDELGKRKEEMPQHLVTVKPFLMGKYPVTQAQWKIVASFTKVNRDLQISPSHYKGRDLPVEQVSWDDAMGVVKSSWSRAIYARDPLRSACQRQITN